MPLSTSSVVVQLRRFNIRPRQNNPSMIILDPAIRARVETIARRLLKGVMPE